jgi:chromosome segregation ATPase
VATLNRFREELEKAREELAPVRSPETGITPLITELRVSGDQLTRMLDELESSGDEKLNLRVESLSKAKIEIEQRVAHIDDCFNILDSIRLDFEELRKRQTHLDRSLAAIETDSGGASLVDRQNALNDFIVECRLRLRNLQDVSTTLSQFNEELAKSQAGLLPLQAPVYGIEALIGEVNAGHAILSRTLDEIEVKGDESLTSRVETLATNKAEVDQRVSRIFEDFQKLDSMRKNIGEMFTSIRGTLNRIG